MIAEQIIYATKMSLVMITAHAQMDFLAAKKIVVFIMPVHGITTQNHVIIACVIMILVIIYGWKTWTLMGMILQQIQ